MTDELRCPRCASTRVHVPNAFDLGASDLSLADHRQMARRREAALAASAEFVAAKEQARRRIARRDTAS